MTSPQSVILSKLQQLQNCIQRIESKKPFTLEQLKTSLDLQDILSLNLQRAVQICVDIAGHLISNSSTMPQTMGDTFTLLNKAGVLPLALEASLKKSVGLRNIIVHEYNEIDWTIVFEVCYQHLNTFKKFAEVAIKAKKIPLE